MKYRTSLFNFLLFRGTNFSWLCILGRGSGRSKPVDTHFNGCPHACRIHNMGLSLWICASSSPSCSLSPLQMMSLIIPESPPPPPPLCHIFLLSHSQTRYSVKAFKVTYIQPLSFPSHSVGAVRGVLHSDLILPSDNNTVPVLVDAFGGDSTTYQQNYPA